METSSRAICLDSVHPLEHSLRIRGQSLPKETVLVTKSLVEARAGQARRLGEVIDRCRRIAVAPKDPHGRIDYGRVVELRLSAHGILTE